MIIDFLVIPHSEQRYPTVGDWWWDHECDVGDDQPWQFTEDRDVLHIRVSKMSDPRYELLVFHHELTEALMCWANSISAEAVDAWDQEYEAMRLTHGQADSISNMLPCGCPISDISEPGSDVHAPYYEAHRQARRCEMVMAGALGVNWNAYSKEIDSL